ncbi:LPD7 domain-containing protein, partial [Aliarcobacter butzleri]|uniref:LPD7 domain-containing protein n=1 Tax=Aliarcobacter butzleri TaxID=28197 RepID=UPI003AF64EE1
MYVKVKVGRKGLVNYLKYGKRFDSDLTRKDKDNTISLYGDINMLEACEKYCIKNKQWKNNYEHITLSFTKEEMEDFSKLDDEEYIQKLKDITEEYIKHRTSGYDLANEVVAYAEAHEPKMKINEKGKERLTHIHIGISKLNILDDTQIKTTFYNNSYISETFNTYICNKYGLEMVVEDKAKRKERLKANGITETKSEWSILREKFINDCKNIYAEDELIKYLNNCGHKWEVRKNKYTVLPKGLNAINIGDLKNFPTIHNIIFNTMPKEKFIEEIRKQKDEKIQENLTSYYKSRIEMIDKRRSKETKQKLRLIYDNSNDNSNSNYIENLTFQQKIFYKYYGHLINEKLKGFFIDTKVENKVRIINKSKDINIVDNGDKICSFSSGTNLQEEIKLMLDIAIAKGWKASAINVNGNDEFKAEANKQLLKLIKKEQEKEELKDEMRKAILINAYERPLTKLQTEFRETKEEELREKINLNEDISIQKIKDNLRAETVINYAVEKYKLNPNSYEIIEDKINNLKNKQKPKNVIDFLQIECNLTTRQAVEECKYLLQNQRLKI